MEEKKSSKIFHIIIFSLVIVVLLFNVFSYFGASIFLPGRELREISGVDPQTGRRTSLDLSKGEVILNIWATWCGACISEMPELNKVAAKHQVYGVIKPVFKYEVYREVSPDFKSVIAQDEFFEDLYISVLPTTLLVKDGVIKKVHTGTMTTDLVEEWVKD
ncbi:TlpA family protein disulfide reductase [bacterium]|nr:TlpA family protein disulfide reductase [bacterium]